MLDKFSAYMFLFIMGIILYTLFFYDFSFVQEKFLDKDLPDFEFTDIKISHYFNGDLELEVSSNRALVYNDRNEIILDQSKGVSFIDDSFIRFNAGSSVFNLETNELRLNDSFLVYYNNLQYYWLSSQEIFWKSIENEIFSNQLTHIYHDNFYIKTNYVLMNLFSESVFLNNSSSIYFRVNHE